MSYIQISTTTEAASQALIVEMKDYITKMGVGEEMVKEGLEMIATNKNNLNNSIATFEKIVIGKAAKLFVFSAEDKYTLSNNGLQVKINENAEYINIRGLVNLIDDKNFKYFEVYLENFDFASVGLATKNYSSTAFVGFLPSSCSIASDGNLYINGTPKKMLKEGFASKCTVGVGIKEVAQLLDCIYYRRKYVYFSVNGEKIGRSFPLSVDGPFPYVSIRGLGATAFFNVVDKEFLYKEGDK
uniref:B30.2/SPRY domain-containing protein n=1 Tax=Meloidogyne javanica TaxID=6303 RepID=A0A915MXW6_MELJA